MSQFSDKVVKPSSLGLPPTSRTWMYFRLQNRCLVSREVASFPLEARFRPSRIPGIVLLGVAASFALPISFLSLTPIVDFFQGDPYFAPSQLVGPGFLSLIPLSLFLLAYNAFIHEETLEVTATQVIYRRRSLFSTEVKKDLAKYVAVSLAYGVNSGGFRAYQILIEDSEEPLKPITLDCINENLLRADLSSTQSHELQRKIAEERVVELANLLDKPIVDRTDPSTWLKRV